MGLLFVRDWIILGYKRLSRADYGIVWLIAIVIGIFGFLQGVAIGLVVTIFVFVFKYSRTSILYRRRSGIAIKSNMERSLHHARELRKLMGSVHVIELQGFLFFGTATTLLEAIRERVKDPEEPALEYIVIDFRRVQGIDASALMNFTKAAELARQNNFTLVLTGITPQLESQLTLMLEHDAVVVEPTLDYGIEYCEKMLLDAVMVTQPSIISTLPLQLQEMGMSKAVAARLIPYLETKKVAAGETLISQGDESTDLYFVQIGQVSVMLEADHGTRIRLHTMTMGTVVGELGFYLQTQRSASVIVDVFSIVHRLSTDSIDRMKSEDPQLAIELHEMLTRIIAARLVNTNQAMIAMN
jgi:SulP family sulfate permease